MRGTRARGPLVPPAAPLKGASTRIPSKRARESTEAEETFEDRPPLPPPVESPDPSDDEQRNSEHWEDPAVDLALDAGPEVDEPFVIDLTACDLELSKACKHKGFKT